MQIKAPDIREIIFWDIDYSAIDSQKYANFIIQRVFERGSLYEISELYRFYGKERLLKELKNIDSFQDRIKSFIAFYCK